MLCSRGRGTLTLTLTPTLTLTQVLLGGGVLVDELEDVLAETRVGEAHRLLAHATLLGHQVRSPKPKPQPQP